MPLENVEWEALQNVKRRALINETYNDIIELVVSLNLQRVY